MFDVIKKKEFFQWCDDHTIDNLKLLNVLREQYPAFWFLLDIKSAQDGWVLSMLNNPCNRNIAEIGGSDSRILPKLKHNNECWNIDKLDGSDGGSTYKDSLSDDVRVIRSNLGEYSSLIPDQHFDYVISVSVIEHIDSIHLTDFFKDMYRIMKNGSKSFHAIDFYLTDKHDDEVEERVRILLSGAENAGLRLIEKPTNIGSFVVRPDYATHSDMGLMGWNLSVPEVREKREISQVVSFKCGWYKP